MSARLAVVLFNLGGPDRLESVEPFLANLFSDPAIIALPGFLRRPLARLIARRRAPVARKIYAELGGGSPLLPNTLAQARALERALAARGQDARCFISMRYWNPRAEETAAAVRAYAPDEIVLLPLYPQFSTTTTASSLADWRAVTDKAGVRAPTRTLCCYPEEDGFVAALAELIRPALAEAGPRARLLLSAHGLPEKIVKSGDPYPFQIERSAAAVVARLAQPGLDWRVCYQSRVGPLQWIGPATDAEIIRAGRDRMSLVVAPIAFVSEHSETLVELDIEYRQLAEKHGVPRYLRVPTVGTEPAFIDALAGLVERVLARGETLASGPGPRLCSAERSGCPCAA